MSGNQIPTPGAKTTSAIVNAGNFAYIFVNRPNTDTIDVVRFVPNDSKSAPIQGKISSGQTSIAAKEGPIATIPYSSGTSATHIALYFFNTQGGISEIKLDNADSSDTDPKAGWRSSTKDGDISFARSVPAARSVDSTSFLAGSARNDRPSVVFTAAGYPDDVNFTYYDENGQWVAKVLPAPVDGN